MAIKTEDNKISCNDKFSKTSNKVIDALWHKSYEEELSSEKDIVNDDTDMSSSSESLEDELDSAVIVIDGDYVEDKDNNTSVKSTIVHIDIIANQWYISIQW